MAKATKVKRKDVSIHSRAARRATSPSINVDKAILNTERPKDDYTYSGGYAGVEKKRKQKKMTRQQRLRLEKGMERAEQNSDKLLQKVADSRSREKKVKTRNAPWEELNEKVLAAAAVASAPAGDSITNDEDHDDDETTPHTLTEPAVTATSKPAILAAPVDDDEDEIL